MQVTPAAAGINLTETGVKFRLQVCMRFFAIGGVLGSFVEGVGYRVGSAGIDPTETGHVLRSLASTLKPFCKQKS